MAQLMPVRRRASEADSNCLYSGDFASTACIVQDNVHADVGDAMLQVKIAASPPRPGYNIGAAVFKLPDVFGPTGGNNPKLLGGGFPDARRPANVRIPRRKNEIHKMPAVQGDSAVVTGLVDEG